jgi:hypothetical protein
MTKDQWVEMKNRDEFPLEVWFEYYKERGGIVSDIGQFRDLFIKLVQAEPRLVNNGKVISTGTALNNLKEYYNSKFG